MPNCLREAGVGNSNPLTPTSASAEALFIDFVQRRVSLSVASTIRERVVHPWVLVSFALQKTVPAGKLEDALERALCAAGVRKGVRRVFPWDSRLNYTQIGVICDSARRCPGGLQVLRLADRRTGTS